MTILYKFLNREEDIDLTMKAAKIFDHYGESHQLAKLVEESGEFAAALMRWSNCRREAEREKLRGAAMEELADMTLVLQQLVDSMPADVGRAFAAIVHAKADRQLRRISQEIDHAKRV